MLDLKLYESKDENAWCPGCGNFGILEALKETLAELEIYPSDVVIASGIGQAAKTPHYINANGFNGLHGRSVPPAVAIKMANKNLKVIIDSGDGDSYGEGGNHLLHNIRRNVDICHFVHDNQIYGLTKGQGSPMTAQGQVTTMQFEGVVATQFNPLTLAITQGCGFVARSFSGDKEHLKKMMKAAILHNGYAILDILQPCVTYNKVNTFKWYKDRVYKLDENYNYNDKELALKTAAEFGDRIPIGILYSEEKPSYMDRLEWMKDSDALVNRKWSPSDAQKFIKDFV